MRKIRMLSAFCIFAAAAFSQDVNKRLIQPSDIYHLQTVSDPHVSPEGKWVVYVLSTVDSAKDRSNSDIWMTSWDGQQNIQITNASEGESSPAWSPDGKWISFISNRQGQAKSQVWLMDRRGGEATKLTDLKGDLSSYVWSPDGKKLALVMRDPEYPDTSKQKTPKPIVIDRYHFKQDVEGYLQRRPTHLYLFDISTKKLDTPTSGIYDETSPDFSPDGKQIVFVSNRSEDPDLSVNSDIYVIDARPGSAMKQLTTWTGRDNAPVWSPDGKQIAYLRSTYSDNYTIYDQSVLCVIPATGGQPKVLTEKLDRPVSNPRWDSKSQQIFFLVTDDRENYIAEVSLPSGQINRLVDGKCIYTDVEGNALGNWVTVRSDPKMPQEIYAVEGKQVRRLTTHQDKLLSTIQFAEAEPFTSKSSDGTSVSGLYFRPANSAAHTKLPMILFIHGGPVGQDDWGFSLTSQTLAAAGYVVAQVNYRGSNGRGINFSNAISGNWGHKEVQDLLGAVDYLVQQGIADPDRLGIGGWSYGGILTDYTIATDNRFKAAASGAGSALQLSMYGVDQYTLQYDKELGPPWKSLDKWLDLSYPFLKADKIKTPVLFMAGEKDFNVPAVGSEQMYQALRSLGIPTQLIIYPGQFHGIRVPSYQVDRLTRYIDWFDKYLKK
jgi:dipeptidyl aminopeptidase/acylaminoacyl peptidase